MHSSRWLIVVFVVLASSQSGWTQQRFSRVQMEADVRELFDVTGQRYSYIAEKKAQYGIDLRTLEADALKRLDKVKSDADFHGLLQESLAGLKDGQRGKPKDGQRVWQGRESR